MVIYDNSQRNSRKYIAIVTNDNSDSDKISLHLKIEKMVDVKGFAKSIVNGREFYYLDFAS